MRNPLLTSAFLTCLAIGTAAPAHPQEPAQECATDARPANTAIVEGTVRDRATAVPLQDVTVRLTWFQSRGARQSERTVETDRSGAYRFCEAPAGLVFSVVAEGGSARSRPESMMLGDGERAAVDLRMNAAYSRVRGRVIDHENNQPIAAAVVDLGQGALRRLTADDGTFQLDSIPAGVYTVRVQHVAYAELRDSIAVDHLARLQVTIRIAPTAIPLDPIEVVVRSGTLELRGFYDRQTRGIGTFLSRQEIDAMHALRGTDILRRVAGIRLVQQRNWPGLMAIGRGNCPYRFVIDGVRINEGYSIDEMPPTWIEGIEIYAGPSQVPIEWTSFSSDPNGNCGVIVVWTRNRA